jgi:hypothetical protein
LSQFFYGSSGDLNANRIRLGSGFSLTEAAQNGTYAMSKIVVDDPAGDLDIVGHHSFRAIETACSWETLFRGYFADRTISRAASMLTGAARRWDATVYDLNGALQFEIIRGSGAQRPAETDTARLAWLLGSAYLGPISSDSGCVFGAGVDLDKQDYRGMTAADVLSDCAQVSGNNYFVAWSDSVGSPVLHYYDPARAFNDSTLSISNVASDVDESTVFAPDQTASLNRDPSLVYSGLYLQYGDRTSAAVYETSSTVLSAIGHKREYTQQDPSLSTSAKASAKAQKWLHEAEVETDLITVTLYKVPPSKVNLIRAGQRMQVRFTHLPGYESFTWVRVQRRTVEQDGETQQYYRLTLQLSDPKQGGSQVRHRPGHHPDADTADTAGPSISVTALQSAHDTLVEDAFTGLFTAGTPYVGSWISQNTAYTVSGCPLGGGLWGPGGETWEAWYTVTISGAADILGLRVQLGALGTILGVAANESLLVGWANAAPTKLNDWFEVGAIDPAAGGEVWVPGGLVDNGGTNYLVIAPAWIAVQNWAVCGNYITSNFGGPVVGGEGLSGRAIAANTSHQTVTAFVGGAAGKTSWVSPAGSGDADGTNDTWTLTSWNGYGIPEARWGAIILSAATDYTYDEVNRTITFREPPPAGTQVAFRFFTGEAP